MAELTEQIRLYEPHRRQPRTRVLETSGVQLEPEVRIW